MPFQYEGPGANELRQGEILASVTDFRTDNAAAIADGAAPIVTPRLHNRAVVVTSDCDLLKDYSHRQTQQPWNSAHLLEHILVCDVFADNEIVAAMPAGYGAREWEKIKGNQYERYHRFPAAQPLPEIFLDFKRCLGVPPETLYTLMAANQVTRIARIAPVFLQDLTHRLYGYLSRVGPEFN